MPTSARTRAARSTTSRGNGRKPPSATLVLLVRHGTTPTTGKILPGQAAGLHLAEKGRAQAEVAATRIAALHKAPVAVYASPLERTKETAAPIAKALGLRVRTCPRPHRGGRGRLDRAAPLPLAKSKEWPAVHRWPSGFRFPGGESFAEMSVRAMEAVLGLVAEHPGQTVVAVSHADPIKAIVAAGAGVPST